MWVGGVFLLVSLRSSRAVVSRLPPFAPPVLRLTSHILLQLINHSNLILKKQRHTLNQINIYRKKRRRRNLVDPKLTKESYFILILIVPSN